MKGVRKDPMSEDETHNSETIVGLHENGSDSYQRLDFLRDVAIQQLAMLSSQISRPSMHEPEIAQLDQRSTTSRCTHDRAESYPQDHAPMNSVQRSVPPSSQGKNCAPQKPSRSSSRASSDDTDTYSASPGKLEVNETNYGKRTRPTALDSSTKLLRKGKWTREEEEYANAIIRYHESGLLLMPYGESLRSYLSKRLNCDGMRITKKFANTTNLAQRSYSLIGRDISLSDLENARNELTRLEQRFRHRILNSNGHDQISESGSSVAVSLTASERPVHNRTGSTVQSSPIDHESLTKSMSLINPLLASIFLQQLLSKNPSVSMNTSDSVSSYPEQEMKMKGENLNMPFTPATSDEFIQQAHAVVNGATSWQSPAPPDRHNDLMHFHGKNKEKVSATSLLGANIVEQMNAHRLNGITPAPSRGSQNIASLQLLLQTQPINEINASKEKLELEHFNIAPLLGKLPYQEETTACSSWKQALKGDEGSEIINVGTYDTAPQKNESSTVQGWDAKSNEMAHKKAHIEDNTLSARKSCQDGMAVQAIGATDVMIAAFREPAFRCNNKIDASRGNPQRNISKDCDMNMYKYKDDSHQTSIESSNTCSDECNNGKIIQSLASQRLLGFLSELRKNHQAAMAMSFGVEPMSTTFKADHGSEVASSLCTEEEKPSKIIPVRTVSQTFSTSTNSNHDHSSVSTLEQSLIPNICCASMKLSCVRDVDVISSMSGDTGSCNGQGKIETLSGVINEAHETESSTSSECHGSSNEGAYNGSCNTSGNSTSDDEIGSITTSKNEYLKASYSVPLRKRLKYI